MSLMPALYRPELVALSVAVACLASYATLSVATRASSKEGRAPLYWAVGGALVLGFGIWAMHFIGMLALSLPVPIYYSLSTTLLSWLAAVLAAALALRSINRHEVGLRALLVGGLLLGLSISSMHYLGMQAMRFAGKVTYEPLGVALSVLVAFSAATLALGLGLRVRVAPPGQQERWRLAGALLLGGAIAAMHYTAMHAAHFHTTEQPTAPLAHGILSSAGLARGVALIAVTLLGAAVWALLMNERVARSTARSAELQRLNTELECRVAERTAALEQAHAELLAYAVAVSHDLAEPTRRATGVTHLLERALAANTDPKVKRYLALLRQEVALVDTHVTQLRQLPFFRGRPVQFAPVSLNVLVVQVRSDLEPLLRGRRVQWVMTDLPGVRGDAMLLRLVLTEVLAGALEAAGQEPRLEISGWQQGNQVVVQLRHSAPGTPAVRPSPLLPSRPGERIGLTTARRVLQQHGGSLQVEGNVVTLRLPSAQAAPGLPASRESAAEERDLKAVQHQPT
ncbi:MHYT domain-containing protein [Deinococcus sp. YIM 77859]|uniref:MHYT domain-containing protein n=1 Tax=Deinococcus sp. YIM 77859 TaxID=1540221 RepID=UPI00068AE40D|nr:MHYT domain-containing protein [Deinococcus sp. YIM 77859]